MVAQENDTRKSTHKILVIEDQKEVRDLLSSFLQVEGYLVKTAENGSDGIFILTQWLPDIISVDLNMPIMGGHEFIKTARQRWPEVPIVVVSGVGAVDEAVEALRLGAVDLITKPIFNFPLVINTLEKAIETATLKRQNRDYQHKLEAKVAKRTKELEEIKNQLLYSLGKSAEYRDNETGRHVIRVGKICALMGRALGMDETLAKTFGDAAPLHDIGKIGIADSILLKPGKLDAREWDTMQQHCQIGCDILRPYSSRIDLEESSSDTILKMADSLSTLSILEMAMVIALCHHEKWDGSGYPNSLSGTQIPLIARIVAVVDVYDALGSERPYKETMPEEKCQRIIREGAGNHFDPEVVRAFFDNIKSIVAIKNEWLD